MKHYTPALNGLEQAAFNLIAIAAMAQPLVRESKSKLAQEAWDAALVAFVETEAEYLGLDKQWEGAHDRAEELCKGL